jgi:tRNA-splicing ligase RtcB
MLALKKYLTRTAVVSSYTKIRRFSTASLPIVHSKEKIPIYIYSKIEQEELMNQLIGLANSGIAEHYISVMPDVHLGKGATVGTVFASSNFVSPNAVGVDIGCGMCAVPVPGLSAS